MLNSLRDGQINYGTPNCPSAHVPPHNVVAPIHQNSSSLISTEPSAPVVYPPWTSNPRLEHLYGFHSRYYNLDFPTSYHPPPPPNTNQYNIPPANIYGQQQNVPQCCRQPCCQLRSSQNIPKTSPSQPSLYNPIRPAVQQLNRSNKSKKTLKTTCSVATAGAAAEQFLPYIPNDLPPPVKYDTQNYYQQKYSGSYLNNTNYCPPANNNLWIPPAANPTWAAERLRPTTVGGGRHSGMMSPHDFGRDKNNYQRFPNYHQSNNPYSNPTGVTHRPYDSYIPPPVIPADLHDYHRPPIYHHDQLKNNSTSEYVSHEHNSRLLPMISSQNNQSSPSTTLLQQYYNNAQPAAAAAAAVPSYTYADVQRPSEPFKCHQIASQNSPKSNLNVREFLATWDEGEEEVGEKPSETTAPIVVLDCMTLEGDALTKVQEKLNVVSYEHLEKVLKENQNPIIINNAETNEIDSAHNKTKSAAPSLKPNFEPLDYTKRETGIIKPFISEKKTSPETSSNQSEKSYSVNFDGMVAWYGKKNADISSTDLIERLADKIFNLSKSQENEGVSFGTASYTGQITQTNNNRSVDGSVKDPSKYNTALQSHQQMFDLQHHTVGKCIEPSAAMGKIGCDNDFAVPSSRIHSRVLNENQKSTVKSNGVNSSCIVENMTKKCLNIGEETTAPWNLDQSSPQEQHLNMSLYDHSVIMKPLDFSSLTDESKVNPFAFEKNTSVKPTDGGIINDQYGNKTLNENNNYHSSVSNSHQHQHHHQHQHQHQQQHAIHQMDSSNRNFPVIVSPHVHRQEYNGFHESVIQRTGCDKSKHDKVSAQPDFENMNWNISNDLDKIMKNTGIAAAMEPSSCMTYDRNRNNYNNMLDNNNMNPEKIVSTQWKDDVVPCIDLTVNSSKMNNHHDSFFDGWNFIDTFENHSGKKTIVDTSSNNNNNNNNVIHCSPLFPNHMASLDESNNTNRRNSPGAKLTNETSSLTVKDISFSKPVVNMQSSTNNNSAHSRSVFNLNNRIPDFSDGFELSVMNNDGDGVPHEYMQFKNKLSNDNENRTDGSIFEHLTDPKSVTRAVETTINVKNDNHNNNNKSDIVGLPSFKEKEPLAPMPVPPKLNVVKPIIRDPSQIYTVIKQKSKYGGGGNNNHPLPCAENDNAVSNKTGHNILLRGNHQTSLFHNGATDLKSKYNNAQLNHQQFDVWSEKFVLKGNSNDSSSAVVQCDVEITQFKSTPENHRSASSIPKPNVQPENYHHQHHDNKDGGKLPPANADCCNLIADKMNVIIGNEKINSNDFLNCLENNAKTNDQKYRDTLDEFETSFGFDIHCNNDESNKSFHEDIVDKCLEETIKDKIGEHNINTSVVSTNNNTSNGNTLTSDNNNTTLPFQCNFQSSYLIKNYFDGNKDKGVSLELQKQNGGDHENPNFDYRRDIENEFELRNNKNIRETQNCEKNSDFNITVLDINRDVAKRNGSEKDGSNFSNRTELKRSFDSRSDDNTADISKMSSREKNSFDYRDFELVNNKKPILEESTGSKEIIMDNNHRSNIHDLSDVARKRSSVNVDFENINGTNIFENNSNASTENADKTTNANHELQIAKINFESAFHCENTGNVERRIDNKNIFEVENNNSDLYEAQNLEKMHEFDFETRIIRNFDVECSNSNVQKPTSPLETCTNKNEKNTEYSYERNGTENEIQKETNFISALSVHKESQIQESSGVDCNGNTRFSHVVIETENKNNKIDDIFDVTDTERVEFNLQTRHTDFSTRNDDAEEINLNNGNDESSNANINVEVENIFENLFDNLKTLNMEKDPEFFKNQNDDKCNVAESFENIESPNLKTNNSSISHKDCKETKCRDECGESFEETNNVVLLQEFVNNSTSRLMSISSRQNQMSEKAKNSESDEFNVKKSVERTPSKNDDYVYIPKKTAAYENNNVTFKEQKPEYVKQNEMEIINQNNVQTLSNTTIDVIQGDTVNKTFENIESDLFKLKTTDKSPDEEFRQNYTTRLRDSLNNVERRENSNDIAEVEDSFSSDSSSSDPFESARREYFNEFSEVEDSSSSDSSSSLQYMKFTRQQDSKRIGVVDEDLTSSLNHVDSTHQEHFDEIIKEDAINSELITTPLNDLEFTDQKDATSSGSSSLNHVDSTHHERFNEIIEEDSINSEPSSLNNDVESTRQQGDINTVVEIKDLTFSPKCVGPTNQERFNDTDETKDLINTERSSLNDVEFTRERDTEDIVEVEGTTRSLSDVEPIHQKHFSKLIDAQDSIDTESTSLNDVEITREQDSKDIVEVENSTGSECNSLNDVEPTHQEHFNVINEANDSIDTKPSSLNDVEFTGQQDYKDIVENEDSASSECNSFDDDEPTHQEHYNDMSETNDSIDTKRSSLNDVGFTDQKDTKAVVDVDDSTSSECNSFGEDEPTHQEHCNDMIEAENSIYIEPSSLNDVKFTDQKDHKAIVDVEDSTSSECNSFDDDEPTHHEHCNDIIETNDSIDTKRSSLNDVGFTDQNDSKAVVDVDDSTGSECNSFDEDEPTHEEHYNNDMIEAEDSIDSESSSLSDVEFTDQKYSKAVVDVEHSTSSDRNSVNDVVEPIHQEHNFDMIEADDSIDSESRSLSDDEFSGRQDFNDMVEVKDTVCSLLNHVESPTYREHNNDTIEAEDSVDSQRAALNDFEFTGQQGTKDIPEVADSTGFEFSPLSDAGPTYREHNDDTIEAEDSVDSQRAALNDFEYTGQQGTKDIPEVADSTGFEFSPFNDAGPTYREHNNDTIEAEGSIDTKPTSLNDFGFARERESEENIPEVEESTGSLNRVERTRQERFNGIVETENPTVGPGPTDRVESAGHRRSDETVDDRSTTSESLPLFVVNGVCQTNGGGDRFKNTCTGSERAVDGATLPRVKFVLKCRSTTSVLSKNVFDEPSAVVVSPYKKRNAAKSEKFIARNVLRKRNRFYKPWPPSAGVVAHGKQQSPLSDDPKEPVAAAPETAASSRSDHVAENVGFDGERTRVAAGADVVSPPAQRTFAAEEREEEWRRRDDETLTLADAVENACDEHTPMPSPPFDGFGSGSETPEHGDGVEEYWDKSLENEYRNVLHKTISKLAKAARACCRVRDRFNTRLMMGRKRGTNAVTRRRKRRRRLQRLVDDGGCDATERRVGDDRPTAVGVPATKYKIKVQLPWGRIFNLNNRDDGDQNGGTAGRDTKLELGPAKVEVRLTRTPGEWQVAACESMTSRRKSVVSVRRLVLRRAASPSKDDCEHTGGGGGGGGNDNSGCCGASSSSSSGGSGGGSSGGSGERIRKLPKIVIRRNGLDNNYTSYVRSGGGGIGGGGGGGGCCDEDDGCPRLTVRLVRNRKLDAMAADGITTLHLKHIVPIEAECAAAAVAVAATTTTAAAAAAADTHGPKRVRYA